MIIDLLDNDLQKFLIGYILWRNPHIGNLSAELTLIDRNHKPLKIVDWIKSRGTFQRNPIRCDYLKKLGFPQDYIDHINNVACMPYQLKIENDRIYVRGKWADITFWEVPLMYTEVGLRAPLMKSIENYIERTRQKFLDLPQCKIMEFGTRRRFNAIAQLRYIENIRDLPNFLGTSNVLYSKLCETPCLGSVGHELYQGCGTLYGPHKGTRTALRLIKETGLTSIALTDTFTTPFFIKCFEGFQRAFSTLRQDSGDAASIGRTLVNYQKSQGIRPSIIFSDALNGQKMITLEREFGDDIKAFGVGGWISHDLGYQENVVCKLTMLNDMESVKLSDDPDKATGDKDTVKRIRDYVHNFV